MGIAPMTGKQQIQFRINNKLLQCYNICPGCIHAKACILPNHVRTKELFELDRTSDRYKIIVNEDLLKPSRNHYRTAGGHIWIIGHCTRKG